MTPILYDIICASVAVVAIAVETIARDAGPDHPAQRRSHQKTDAPASVMAKDTSTDIPAAGIDPLADRASGHFLTTRGQ